MDLLLCRVGGDIFAPKKISFTHYSRFGSIGMLDPPLSKIRHVFFLKKKSAAKPLATVQRQW